MYSSVTIDISNYNEETEKWKTKFRDVISLISKQKNCLDTMYKDICMQNDITSVTIEILTIVFLKLLSIYVINLAN